MFMCDNRLPSKAKSIVLSVYGSLIFYQKFELLFTDEMLKNGNPYRNSTAFKRQLKIKQKLFQNSFKFVKKRSGTCYFITKTI